MYRYWPCDVSICFVFQINKYTMAAIGDEWNPIASVYNPISIGSIDGIVDRPHDRGIVRAMNSKYRPNKGVEGVPENTIFVGRLNQDTTKQKLEEIFEVYGPIKHIRVVCDIITGFSKGYGFVEFKHRKDTERAYRNAHRKVIDGNTILVDYEHERIMPGWKPRRFGGGFGGKKEAGQLRFGCRERPFLKPFDMIKQEIGEDAPIERDRRRERDRERATYIE